MMGRLRHRGSETTRIAGKGFQSSLVTPEAPHVAPRLGQDTAEILQELGFAPGEIEALMPSDA